MLSVLGHFSQTCATNLQFDFSRWASTTLCGPCSNPSSSPFLKQFKAIAKVQ